MDQYSELQSVNLCLFKSQVRCTRWVVISCMWLLLAISHNHGQSVGRSHQVEAHCLLLLQLKCKVQVFILVHVEVQRNSILQLKFTLSIVDPYVAPD